VVISPTGVAGKQFDGSYLRYLRHDVSLIFFFDLSPSLRA
jgi:hypothetical protein